MKIQKNTGSNRVVVDTNALVAIYDCRDKWHQKAVEIFSKLESGNFTSVYFDCVMNESISVLARRTEEQNRADDFQNALEYLLNQIPEEMIEWVSKETQRLYQEVVSLVRDTDGELNFHDALIAIRCRELKIKLIFSFDRDFDRVEWLYRIGELNDIPFKEIQS